MKLSATTKLNYKKALLIAGGMPAGLSDEQLIEAFNALPVINVELKLVAASVEPFQGYYSLMELLKNSAVTTIWNER